MIVINMFILSKMDTHLQSGTRTHTHTHTHTHTKSSGPFRENPNLVEVNGYTPHSLSTKGGHLSFPFRGVGHYLRTVNILESLWESSPG